MPRGEIPEQKTDAHIDGVWYTIAGFLEVSVWVGLGGVMRKIRFMVMHFHAAAASWATKSFRVLCASFWLVLSQFSAVQIGRTIAANSDEVFATVDSVCCRYHLSDGTWVDLKIGRAPTHFALWDEDVLVRWSDGSRCRYRINTKSRDTGFALLEHIRSEEGEQAFSSYLGSALRKGDVLKPAWFKIPVYSDSAVYVLLAFLGVLRLSMSVYKHENAAPPRTLVLATSAATWLALCVALVLIEALVRKYESTMLGC